MRFLSERRVPLGKRYAFSRAIDDLATLRDALHAGTRLPLRTPDAARRFFANAFGADVFTALVHQTIGKTAEPFHGHWKLFRSGEPIQTREGARSQERNKLWELFVGASVAHFAEELRVEEPDLTCSYLGTRWGIACKTFHSSEPATHLTRLAEGAKQLEAADVAHGVIVVNLVNVLPHRDLFMLHRAWDFSRGGDPVVEHVKSLALSLIARIPGEKLVRALVGRSTLRWKSRAVIFFCPTIMHVAGRPMLTCAIVPYAFRRVEHEMERRFASSFVAAIESAMAAPPLASS